MWYIGGISTLCKLKIYWLRSHHDKKHEIIRSWTPTLLLERERGGGVSKTWSLQLYRPGCFFSGRVELSVLSWCLSYEVECDKISFFGYFLCHDIFVSRCLFYGTDLLHLLICSVKIWKSNINYVACKELTVIKECKKWMQNNTLSAVEL